MATCINTTFKNNDEEMQIYLECINHTSRVGFIKDCIKFFMKYGHLEKQLKILIENDIKIKEQ